MSLYKQYAHYYEVISNDRNFKKQFELINSFLIQENSPSKIQYKLRFLELFAGPAYHSIIASSITEYDILAIDNSSEMKEIAMSNGFSNGNNYIISDLPLAISDLPLEKKLDCVVCLRYSLGYLNINEVFQLLTELKKRLSENGKIFIELHEISTVLNSMKSTNIHLRTARNKFNEEVECIWPKGDIIWNKDSYLAEMNVGLKIQSGLNKVKEVNFISKENIHSAELLAFLAHVCGLNFAFVSDKYKITDIDKYFKNSILIEIKK